MEQHGEVRSAHQYLQEMDTVIVPEVGNRKMEEAAKARKAVPSVTLPPDSNQSKREKEEAAAKVKAILTEWSASAECGAGCVKEFSSSLTAYERLVVHQWAEEHGFQHRSVGENHNRRIQIQKPVPVAISLTEVKVAESITELSPEISVDNTTKNSTTTTLALTDELEKIGLNSDSNSSKKKKNKKPNPSSEKAHPGTSIKQKPIPTCTESDGDMAKCSDCQKSVPKTNLALHRLRCTGSGPVEQAVRPKQKPTVKPLPQLDQTKEIKKEKKTENIDDVLSEFRQLDNVCNYATCKTGISLMGQQCKLCVRRFCLSHHLPEIHGCGDAIRKEARSVTLKQGFVAPGTIPVKPKAVDAAKRAHLQRKLDKKLQDMSTQRAGNKEDKKKKK